MTSESGDRIDIKVDGGVSGQFIVGDRNRVVSGQTSSSVTPAEFAELKELIDQVRRALDDQPDDETVAGLAKLDELDEAITGDEADLATMEHVRGWFARKMPGLAGMVGRIIVNPITTKIIAAAGDDLAAEFRRRFGP
jgi:hypothetical protein